MGDLVSICNRWAIINELHFTGIAVEQPVIMHTGGPTIDIACCKALCLVQFDCSFYILLCSTKRLLKHFIQGTYL